MKKAVFILVILMGLFVPNYSYASVLDDNLTHVKVMDSNIVDKKEYFKTTTKQHNEYILTNSFINNINPSTKNLNIVIIFLFGIVLIMMIYTLFRK